MAIEEIEMNVVDLQGLSTDTKPTIDANVPLGAGSTFYELDTGNTYTFSPKNTCPTTSTKWWPI